MPVNVVTTDVSISMSSAFTVIPVPEPTLSVTSPDVPPPARPVPATTDVTSPT